MNDYPAMLLTENHVEPVPRRIRAVLGGQTVLDSTHALYVWEWPPYPQFYIPRADVAAGVLVSDDVTRHTSRGTTATYSVVAAGQYRPGAATVVVESSIPGLRDTLRFAWKALERWYEEDEEVFVLPRNPYARVDGVRSTRTVRVELDGVVLAESQSPVMVFETGLPTRYYLDRTDVRFGHLVPTDEVSECPYKGTTSEYWSVSVNGTVHENLAWAYDFPTRQLQPITGLVAFYNEKVDLFVDGVLLARPSTHFG